MTTNQDLKPCPFCGGPAKKMMGLIGCETCALVRRDAQSWNTRALSAQPAPVAAEGEAVALFLREYRKEIRELTQKADSAESKGYDDAVNTIEEGFSELLAALGLPPEEGDGMDAAAAWIISQVLKQIAEGLRPLKITRNEDDHSYRVTSPPPQSGDAGDEAKLEELLEAYASARIAQSMASEGCALSHCRGESRKHREALRSFFKRAAKGGEGMVSVPRDALETLVETAVVVGERAQTRYQWAKAIVISHLATKQP